MKRERLFAIPPLFFTVLAFFAVSTSFADDKLGPYTQIATIPNAALPSFDISWVDSESGRYYVADRRLEASTSPMPRPTPSSTPLRALSETWDQVFPAQTVCWSSITEANWARARAIIARSCGPATATATVKVVDLETNSVVDSISTGGTHRADELAYDPADKIILIANDRDTVSFVTFISAETRTVLGPFLFSIHRWHQAARLGFAKAQVLHLDTV